MVHKIVCLQCTIILVNLFITKTHCATITRSSSSVSPQIRAGDWRVRFSALLIARTVMLPVLLKPEKHNADSVMITFQYLSSLVPKLHSSPRIVQCLQRFSKFLQHPVARARTVPSNQIAEGFEFCSLIGSHG